jgi:DNA-binding GntR family transcriptional regulator
MGIRAVASGNDRARTVLEEHTAIVRALAAGDAGEALQAHLASTLEVLRRQPLRGGQTATPCR